MHQAIINCRSLFRQGRIVVETRRGC
jgi:hypothetical protein